jgi:hypothetical protein
VIQQDWVEASVQALDERKALELAKLDSLELEYWDAWKRSQKDAEVETTKYSGAAEGAGKIEKQKRVEAQVGDARFLAGVMSCIERRCQILGIDAPKKIDATTGGQPIGQTDEKQFDRAILSLAETVREILPGAGAK